MRPHIPADANGVGSRLAPLVAGHQSRQKPRRCTANLPRILFVELIPVDAPDIVRLENLRIHYSQLLWSYGTLNRSGRESGRPQTGASSYPASQPRVNCALRGTNDLAKIGLHRPQKPSFAWRSNRERSNRLSEMSTSPTATQVTGIPITRRRPGFRRIRLKNPDRSHIMMGDSALALGDRAVQVRSSAPDMGSRRRESATRQATFQLRISGKDT